MKHKQIHENSLFVQKCTAYAVQHTKSPVDKGDVGANGKNVRR